MAPINRITTGTKNFHFRVISLGEGFFQKPSPFFFKEGGNRLFAVREIAENRVVPSGGKDYTAVRAIFSRMTLVTI